MVGVVGIVLVLGGVGGFVARSRLERADVIAGLAGIGTR
jgi:hypothetical protein